MMKAINYHNGIDVTGFHVYIFKTGLKITVLRAIQKFLNANLTKPVRLVNKSSVI